MDLTVSFQLPRDYVSPVQPMKRRRLTLILKLECQRCEHSRHAHLKMNGTL